MVTMGGLARAMKKVLYAPWKMGVWVLAWVFRLVRYTLIGVSLAGILAVVVVMGHGLWHMSQPLEHPRFNGLTYWQALEWEKMVTDRQAAAWNRAHPHARKPASWKTCVESNVVIFVLLAYPKAAQIHLPLLFEQGIHAYFQTVDSTWEEWALKAYGPSLVRYCSTPTTLPTPSELEQMRTEYRIWKEGQGLAGARQSP